jgi:ribosomal protein S18 acetylase RimI-like enzyme
LKKDDIMEIEKSLPKSLYCLCALADNEIIGMARVIGEDGMVYYIQDVIVRPEYKRQGIGRRTSLKYSSFI